MPTLLVERLIDKNFDVKRWMVEDVIRDFGICARLRDTSSSMSSSEIRESLLDYDEDHYRVVLSNAQKWLEQLEAARGAISYQTRHCVDAQLRASSAVDSYDEYVAFFERH